MRMSCNGCRVLRKACGEKCSIRACLRWMESPESQANATVFLAKFYGRAGLVNLLDAAHPHHRPAVFRSLLYEACGRIVNPVYGSVGLLWSGSWALCQTAVDAVLAGTPITPVSADAPAAAPPGKDCDIRHVVKGDRRTTPGSGELHRAGEVRTRFKRAGRAKGKTGKMAVLEEIHGLPSPSGHSSSSHGESMVSVEVAEAAADVAGADAPEAVAEGKTGFGAELDLRLGLGFDF